jgi:hypothetical protein
VKQKKESDLSNPIETTLSSEVNQQRSPYGILLNGVFSSVTLGHMYE